jgi:sialate O-acetylesterase
MTKTKSVALALATTLVLLTHPRQAAADVKLASLFTDHMVLQREMKVPIWGTAEPREEVTVTISQQKFGAKVGADGKLDVTVDLAHQKVGTVAGKDGKWLLRLAPLKAGFGPLEMTITGKNTITLKDILIGEVWLCSGQSNMEFTVSKAVKRFAGTINEQEEIAAAKWPQIREFTVKMSTQQTVQTAVKGQWQVCSPETVPAFSAVGYFMARKLHQDLKVPVGIINTSYGASTAQAWISKEMLSSDPDLKQALDSARPKANDQHNPFVLYNAMLAPLIPYAIRGAAWYQGESITTKGTGTYGYLMRALIKDWRQRWNQGDFPFLVVQLPNLQSQNFTSVREEQFRILEAPNTFLTVNIDIGDPKDVHPHNKQEFGRRLALLAEREVYGQKVISQGPIFEGMKIDGKEARLHFASADGKLQVKGDKLLGFEIAGPDGKYQPADAKIEGLDVVVSNANVPTPTNVRYAWEGWPTATLTNSAELPAWPFRTDGYKVPRPGKK